MQRNWGKVILICEGTPFVLVVPITFFHFLHTSEDSFLKWQFGSLLRLIRLLGLFCATLLPSLYIAVVAYHQEMIPTELLTAIAESRENVPFPVVLEVIAVAALFYYYDYSFGLL